MVIVLVRTRMRPDADRATYDQLGTRMFELVQSLPGFLGAAEYQAPDGETVGVIRFASQQALLAWREHPEHVAVQMRGRAELYASYTIEVCEVVRAYDQDTSARRR